MKINKMTQTTVGAIDEEVLAYTAGRDAELDRALIPADCIGSAAHALMLSCLPASARLFSRSDARKIIGVLVDIVRMSAQGEFFITLGDQDVHLAVEKELTKRLGDLGKKIHTGRSRNDQVATDLRLFGKEQLLAVMQETAALAHTLACFAMKHVADPMVGRTHMQPAMPSSVGLWASAHAESLLDDVALLMGAYELNDQCPLGSAASYGVPLSLDRQRVSDLLGFSRPIHNVLYANNARGKMESIILQALGQVMLTLSRLAQDLILFSMPEFGYFSLPASCCTGSSIMPQKKNPDVLELVRARTSKVLAFSLAVQEGIKASPSGYNRDIQEAKEPFMEGFAVTRSSVRIMNKLMAGVQVDREALLAGFTPDVFATDRALELVVKGMPFRDAYDHVKAHLDDLKTADPYKAIAAKTHLGATAGLDFEVLARRIRGAVTFVEEEKAVFYRAISRLLGVRYPLAEVR